MRCPSLGKVGFVLRSTCTLLTTATHLSFRGPFSFGLCWQIQDSFMSYRKNSIVIQVHEVIFASHEIISESPFNSCAWFSFVGTWCQISYQNFVSSYYTSSWLVYTLKSCLGLGCVVENCKFATIGEVTRHFLLHSELKGI